MSKKIDGFLVGCEKYPTELISNRLSVEGNVIACIYKDLLFIDEVKLTSKDFLTEDAVFYYGIAKRIRESGFNVIDEVTILSSMSDVIVDGYNNRGGWYTIQNIIDVVNDKNFETYLDILYRENNLLQLHKDGFNLFTEIEVNNKKVKILDLLRKMTSEQVIDFYEARLNQLASGNNSKILEECDLEITDDWIDSLTNGDESGVPFDICGEDVNGSDVYCLPYTSSQLDGYLEGTSNAIAGFSSSGKTTLATSILMGLAYRGKKILMISNEQKSSPFKLQFLMWILCKKLKYFKVTKKKIKDKKELTEEDIAMIAKAKEIWNVEFKPHFKFIHIADADMNLVKKKVRYYALAEGYDAFFYDTFKLEIDASNNQRTDIQLVEDSRELDKLAKKLNMICIFSVQLAEYMRDNLFLNASCLSNAKQIKEILESMIMIRPVFQEELDSGNKKFYCKPFQKKKVGDKWTEVEYEPDMGSVYRMLFIEKTRSGSSTNDDGVALLLKFIGNSGTFKEVAYCKPRHGRIQ